MKFRFGSSGAKGVPNPTSLALTGFWRSYGGSAPWSGTASAGTSGSNNLTAGTAPAAGTALNGFGTANYNGSTHTLTASGTLDTYASGTVICGWALVRLDTTTTFNLLGNARVGVQTSSGNAYFWVDGGSTAVFRAISTSTYAMITFRADNTNVQIGVNESPGAAGGGSTAAYSSGISPLSGNVYVGSADGVSAFYDGHLAELALTDTVLTNQQFTDMKSYINDRYALSL